MHSCTDKKPQAEWWSTYACCCALLAGFLQVCVMLSLPNALGIVSWTGRLCQELGLQGMNSKI